MSATAIADHVDDDILVEGLAILECKTCDTNAGLWVITIDVEDRGLDHLGDIGRIARGACRTW